MNVVSRRRSIVRRNARFRLVILEVRANKITRPLQSNATSYHTSLSRCLIAYEGRQTDAEAPGS